MGSAAAGREDKKVEKYSNLSENYHFVPVIIKTYGAYGPQALKIIKKIGKKKIQEATGKCPQRFDEVKNSMGVLQRPRLMTWTTKSPIQGNHWVLLGYGALPGSVKADTDQHRHFHVVSMSNTD